MTQATSLSSRAMLVSLSISQWQARKFDRKETAELALRHGTATEVARVNKCLLPGATALDAVHKKSTEIRHWYAQQTLPWTQDGIQILKATAYMDFTREMGQHQRDWWALVEDFVRDYPAMRHQAQSSLQSLFKAEDYPTADEVRQKFDFKLNFSPVPDVKDWRVDVGDAERARLEAHIQQRLTDAHGVALKAAWKRVYDVLAKAHERLSDPENVFKNTLVENAVELCALLPSLNITDDPDLEAMRREIEASLCRQHPDTLRTDPVKRAATSDKMRDLLAKMGGFYGGS